MPQNSRKSIDFQEFWKPSHHSFWAEISRFYANFPQIMPKMGIIWHKLARNVPNLGHLCPKSWEIHGFSKISCRCNAFHFAQKLAEFPQICHFCGKFGHKSARNASFQAELAQNWQKSANFMAKWTMHRRAEFMKIHGFSWNMCYISWILHENR